MLAYPTAVLLIALIVGATSFVLFKTCAGSLAPSKLNIVSWNFYFEIIVCTYTGIVLSLLGFSHYRVDSATGAALDMAFLSTSYAIIAMPLTMLIWHLLLFRSNPRVALDSYLARPMTLSSRGNGNKDELLYWQILSAVAASAVIYTYAHLRSNALLDALSGQSALEVGQARIAASQHFEGNEYIKNILALILAPLSSYVAFGYWRMTRSKKHLAWFSVTAVFALLALVYNGAKAPILFYLITLFLVSVYQRGRASLKMLAGIAALVALLVIGLYVVFAGSANFEISSGPVGRILFSQMAGLPLTFDIFPTHHRFLEGGGFPNWLAAIIGEHHVRSSRVLMEIYNWRGVMSGTAGFMNTFFLAEAWANFGWIGLIVSPVIVGIFIQTIYGTLLSLPKSPVTIAIMAYFVVRIPITGGFVDFIWNFGAICVVFFAVMGSFWSHLLTGFAAARKRPVRA